MEFLEEIEAQIDKLKDNEYGLEVSKSILRGIISIFITIPKNKLKKEISGEPIEFKYLIDIYSIKMKPKLFCLTPYCIPSIADGRDLYPELTNTKKDSSSISIGTLLPDILEFVNRNFEQGGLSFCGDYYLGEKYDLRLLQKANNNIRNVKEYIMINGKRVKYNRVLLISDIYFLLFDQDSWYKHHLFLLFWSSFNNIEKLQKVKDNKSVVIHWKQKEKYSIYTMSLNIGDDRDTFIQEILAKIKTFGMKYDIKKYEEKNMPTLNDINSKKSEKLILKDNISGKKKVIGKKDVIEQKEDKKSNNIKVENKIIENSIDSIAESKDKIINLKNANNEIIEKLDEN